MRWGALIGVVCATGCGSVVSETPQFEITLEVAGPGTLSGGGVTCPTTCKLSADKGTTMTFVGLPTADAQLTSWSLSECGSSEACEITIEGPTVVRATFAWPDRQLTVTTSGSGRVTGPGGLDCGSSCMASVAHGLDVTLVAMPAAGQTLRSWSPPCDANASICSLRMDSDRQIDVEFEPITRTLSVTRAGTGAAFGTVRSEDRSLDCPGSCAVAFPDGASVTLEAIVGREARFDGWSGGGCSGTGSCRVTVDRDLDVGAVFTDTQVSLDVAVDGTGQGTVTSNPLGISCGGSCTARFPAGTEVTLLATPTNTSRVHAWGGHCAGRQRNGDCTLILDSPRSASVTFHENRIHDVGFGLGHTCAVIDPDLLRCFGSNEYGQLGYGDLANRGDGVGPPANANEISLPLVTAVGAGQWHTCAISDSRVYCWGRNADGQLGIGLPLTSANPVPVGPIDLGGGVAASFVGGGAFHTCALAGGTVHCWGRGSDGALGYQEPDSRASPGPAVPLVGSGTIAQLSVGGLHTCVLRNPGVVRCWGHNGFGQLAQGDLDSRGASTSPVVDVDFDGALAVQIGAGGLHTCARMEGGSIRCWGRNQEGQLGLGDNRSRGGLSTDLPIVESVPLPGPAIDLAVSNASACALLVDRRVFCWGLNSLGQLGYGDTVNRGDGTGPDAGVVALPLPHDVVAIRAGATEHFCALRTHGMFCWGSGAQGTLGTGSTANRGDGLGPPANAGEIPLF